MTAKPHPARASESTSQYRPDIDGLRAIAVLSVLFYHVGFSTFAGGFVGVDVFFVISGFLITRLIYNEFEATGEFRFSRFYLRRARRLFPAMFATLFVTSIAAVIWFSPTDLERFGGALIHAVASLSNIFFWNESGYFDVDAQIKPLLHTWSLSVEEQYYIFWPAILVLLLKKTGTRWTFAVLIALGLLSFLLNLDVASQDSRVLNQALPFTTGWFSEERASIFFLTPFRVFEFVIGGVLVWGVRKRPGSALFHAAATLIGLVMISYSVLVYTEDTLFPSYNALLPCVGTALIIYSGDKAGLVGALLRNRLSVGIGLISYSLYLVHWPVFVFYQYQKRVPISVLEGVAICAVSIGAAVAMYFFIEKPYRRPEKVGGKTLSGGAFAAVCLGCAAVAMYSGASMWANTGWSWRYGPAANMDILDLKELQEQTVAYSNQNTRTTHFSSEKPKILVVGDSHARDISNGLSQLLSATHEIRMQHVEEACWVMSTQSPESWKGTKCARPLSELTADDMLKTADIVFIANWYVAADMDGIEDFVALLRRENQAGEALPIIFMGRSVSFTSKFHAEALDLIRSGSTVEDINRLAYERFYRSAARQDDLSRARIQAIPDVKYISRVETLCSENTCDFFMNDRQLAVWDGSHLTLDGAQMVVSRALKNHPEVLGIIGGRD
ncbi:acyltransferase family protein [Hyphomonas sp.]|uniref:acyltransferase family protein n=1 Tax=Hyphomonas sp. TaxID=87 RepID=UPI0025BDE069|nr:acyltransferase family protein [Hyphomonas sp.]